MAAAACIKSPPSLTDEVIKAIKPVNKMLTSDDLLLKCTGGNKQNNKFLNYRVWLQSSCTCRAKTIEIDLFLAAPTNSIANLVLLKIMNVLGTTSKILCSHCE